MFEGKIYEMDKEKPFSGMVYNTYPDGQKEYEGEYYSGKPNGLLRYWYKNGNKMREGKLKDGVPVGKWTTYKDDGSIQQAIEY